MVLSVHTLHVVRSTTVVKVWLIFLELLQLLKVSMMVGRWCDILLWGWLLFVWWWHWADVGDLLAFFILTHLEISFFGVHHWFFEAQFWPIFTRFKRMIICQFALIKIGYILFNLTCRRWSTDLEILLIIVFMFVFDALLGWSCTLFNLILNIILHTLSEFKSCTHFSLFFDLVFT